MLCQKKLEFKSDAQQFYKYCTSIGVSETYILTVLGFKKYKILTCFKLKACGVHYSKFILYYLVMRIKPVTYERIYHFYFFQ